MNIKKFTLSVLSLFFIIASCKKDDDDGIESIPIRDEAEVYGEDIIKIEDYLSSHSFNYEEFNFNEPYSPDNDNFNLKIESIPEGNAGNKIPLIDMMGGEINTVMNVLSIKTVKQSGIDYELYILKIREGLGDNLHSLDRAIVNYNGFLINGDVFDSAVTPINFNLTSIGSIGGVVTGFREGLLEFKTSIGISTAPDGVDTYEGHGIGAVFIPSGLGYFANAPITIGAYKPIIFTLNLIDRLDTDFDFDGIPSHLEDIDGSDSDPNVDSDGDGNTLNDYERDGNGFNNDTDNDGLPNFIDSDDDGDGLLTINEDKDGDGDPTNDDDNNNGIADYLDADSK